MESSPKQKQTEIPFSANRIRHKITQAYELFSLWGETLWKNPHINFLLNSLELKVGASSKVAQDRGIAAACRRCEEEEGGSCCGAGIENKYTPRLLLINLLFGVTLPEERLWPNSCFFLSECGCVLKLRHVLCVNYLCQKIQRMLPSDELAGLQEIIGEEMDAGFLLDETVKKFIGD